MNLVGLLCSTTCESSSLVPTISMLSNRSDMVTTNQEVIETALQQCANQNVTIPAESQLAVFWLYGAVNFMQAALDPTMPFGASTGYGDLLCFTPPVHTKTHRPTRSLRTRRSHSAHAKHPAKRVPVANLKAPVPWYLFRRFVVSCAPSDTRMLVVEPASGWTIANFLTAVQAECNSSLPRLMYQQTTITGAEPVNFYPQMDMPFSFFDNSMTFSLSD